MFLLLLPFSLYVLTAVTVSFYVLTAVTVRFVCSYCCYC